MSYCSYEQMMNDNIYPVFFKCRTLSGAHVKRLEKYFCVHRKSGGGDCGALMSVGDGVYGIAFRNQRDQQAVLQRSEHVLELEDGQLVFTVRDSVESCASSHITTPTAPAQTPEHIPTSSPLPSGEEYELHQGMGRGSNLPKPTALRVVLLGKTGSGKSHLANTIFEEQLFATDHSPNSGTNKCEAKTRTVNGRSVTLIDSPGFFDTGRSEEDVKSEIMNCITECAPGPDAILFVLRLGKFTEQEQAVVTKICQSFTDDALKHAVVVFTHGEQLPEREQIEDFVHQNENLSALVATCGGRCHVFDNKHWNNKQPNNYRSNQFQVEELLRTIETMVAGKNGGYYTNKMLQLVEEKIQEQAEHIRLSSPGKTPEEIRNQAKSDVYNRFVIQMSGIAAGALIGAFFGLVTLVEFVIKAMKNPQIQNATKKVAALACVPLAAGKAETTLIAVGAAGLAAAAGGGIMGGVIGNAAAQDANSPAEAAQRAYKAVVERRKAFPDSM